MLYYIIFLKLYLIILCYFILLYIISYYIVIIFYYIILYSIIFYYHYIHIVIIFLYYITLHYILYYIIIVYRIILYYIILQYITLYCIISYFIILYSFISYYMIIISNYITVYHVQCYHCQKRARTQCVYWYMYMYHYGAWQAYGHLFVSRWYIWYRSNACVWKRWTCSEQCRVRMVHLSPSFSCFFQNSTDILKAVCMFESSVHGYIYPMDINVSTYGILGTLCGSMSYSYLWICWRARNVFIVFKCCCTNPSHKACTCKVEATGNGWKCYPPGKEHTQVWLDVLGAWEDDYVFPEVYPNGSKMIRMVYFRTSCAKFMGTQPEPNFPCEFRLEPEQGSIAEIKHEESGSGDVANRSSSWRYWKPFCNYGTVQICTVPEANIEADDGPNLFWRAFLSRLNLVDTLL